MSVCLYNVSAQSIQTVSAIRKDYVKFEILYFFYNKTLYFFLLFLQNYYPGGESLYNVEHTRGFFSKKNLLISLLRKD